MMDVSGPSHIKTCVKSRLCYNKNLRKINVRNPMGMKLL